MFFCAATLSIMVVWYRTLGLAFRFQPVLLLNLFREGI